MVKPWLKKNPIMSLWLSTANRVAGTLRGQATAQARRQVKSAEAKVLAPLALKAKPRRRR